MPIRTIPKNYRNVTGIAANAKAEGKAMYESTLERDWLMVLEFSADVASLEVQPVRVTWYDDKGKERSYTPDLLVHYHQPELRPLLCEVKYQDDLRKHWAEFKPKFRAAYRYAKSRGWRFKVLNEKHIRTSLLQNARFLLPFTRQISAESPQIPELLSAIQHLERCSVQQLLQLVNAEPMIQAEYLPVLWYLVGTKQIRADLMQKLTMASELWEVVDG